MVTLDSHDRERGKLREISRWLASSCPVAPVTLTTDSNHREVDQVVSREARYGTYPHRISLKHIDILDLFERLISKTGSFAKSRLPHGANDVSVPGQGGLHRH